MGVVNRWVHTTRQSGAQGEKRASGPSRVPAIASVCNVCDVCVGGYPLVFPFSSHAHAHARRVLDNESEEMVQDSG